MFFSIETCTLVGFEVHPVICEVHLANQLPTVTLVGMPSAITQESRERVRAAVLNSALEWPARKVTINLLPATLPKWGSQFELAMALGVLGAGRAAEDGLFALGELSLSGEIRPCRWIGLAAPMLQKKAKTYFQMMGQKFTVIAAAEDIKELCLHMDPLFFHCFEFVGARSLVDALAEWHRISSERFSAEKPAKDVGEEGFASSAGERDLGLLEQVEGEPLAVVAALCAIKSRHHLLLVGPQGVGKTMIAQAVARASSVLTEEDRRAITVLKAMFGEENREVLERPIVRLQSGATKQALEGTLLDSGRAMPGELTRAHRGILMADELLEFHRDVIEFLRQPLEEKCVRLSRARLRTVLPADFQLLATTNLCPCGFLGHYRRKCRCHASAARRYLSKLSGPMLDRFDLIVQMGESLDPSRLRGRYGEEAFEKILWLSDPANWKEALTVNEQSAPLDFSSVEPSFDLSPRGRIRVSRVACTLAALCHENTGLAHLRLALILRADIDRSIREGSAVCAMPIPGTSLL